MARAMLGQWEEAAKDLHLASKLDYDEEISSVLKKVITLSYFVFYHIHISQNALCICKCCLIHYAVLCVQVEPNAHKIEEHRRKYDRLRKERGEKKLERERQRRRAEAQVNQCYFNRVSGLYPAFPFHMANA